MSEFVLDCSIAMAWCFRLQATRYSDEVLESMGRYKAIVPSIWNYEVSNSLLTAERRGTHSRADSTRFLSLLDGLPISTVNEGWKEWRDLLLWMGKSHQLTAYDTAYLYLAMDRGLPLASHDQKMVDAARKAGVSIYQLR